MISCPTSELPAFTGTAEQPVVVAAASEVEETVGLETLVCPRTIEILTVLNDVFDSFSHPAEASAPARAPAV